VSAEKRTPHATLAVIMPEFHNAADITVAGSWAGFTEPKLYLHYLLVLVLASLSGVLLAFHPVQRGRAITLEVLEQRKTMIIYSVVGALIAIICTVSPSMAFVIFGIGGLMRFRTDVGASKNTGHTIMSTLIGLCWGLHLELVAVLATVFSWITIFIMEGSPVRQVTVGGVAVTEMSRSADAYREAIARAGCRVLGHTKDFKRLQMLFVFRMPNRDAFELVTREVAALPDALRGTPDWPE
jgi:hypothetical protein